MTLYSGPAGGGPALTPAAILKLSGLASPATAAQLANLGADVAAGVRGLVLLETWAPEAAAQSHDFAVPAASYAEIEIVCAGVGKAAVTITYFVQPDGADSGCTSETAYLDGTYWRVGYSGAAACVAITNAVAFSFTTRLRRGPSGLWLYDSLSRGDSAYFPIRSSGTLPAGWASLRLSGSEADCFPPGSSVKISGRAAP